MQDREWRSEGTNRNHDVENNIIADSSRMNSSERDLMGEIETALGTDKKKRQGNLNVNKRGMIMENAAPGLIDYRMEEASDKT